MADFYTRFSFMLPATTAQERAWVHDVLDAAADYSSDNDDAVPAVLVEVFGCGYWSLGFSAELGNDGLWIYSEGCGDEDQVVAFVQHYLARFRANEVVGFEWASTCSRPCLDAFGGGAAVVSATEVTWLNTSTWLSETLKAARS